MHLMFSALYEIEVVQTQTMMTDIHAPENETTADFRNIFLMTTHAKHANTNLNAPVAQW